jgi:predicted metalloprotease with PDZ domain
MLSLCNRRSHRAHARVRLAAAVLGLTLAAPLTPQRPTTAHYTVRANGAAATDGEIALVVALRLDAPARDSTVFEVPIWTPGSYRRRDFPERITVLGANAGETELQPVRLGRTAWRVDHGTAESVELRYRVALRPTDRFMDPGDKRRCITYEGPAVYLYAHGAEQAPCSVRFELPDGWTVASGLDPRPDGTHFAPDYDTVADCPVKLGVVQRFGFDSHGKRIEVVLDAGTDVDFDSEKWLRGLQGIVDEGAAIFGGLPFSRYVFLFTASSQGGGGGLEHLNSTAIGVGRRGFVADPASSFGISAHEFFHCWNVKRLRPAELGPFAYDRENRTTGLWLAEGVTSYYGPVLQARAGLLGKAQFWRDLENTIRGWENSPGRLHTSPEQSSWRAWDGQAPDRTVDYYGAGKVLGLLLDLQIRAASRQERSLDDAMRAMWQTCEQRGRGLSADEIEAHCSAAAGVDLGPFFAAHVRGTQRPDYRSLLRLAGISADLQPAAQSAPTLRGLDLSRTNAPAFVDWPSLERSGGGNPLAACGRVRQIDGQPAADADACRQIVAAAFAAGRTTVAVDYETGNGSQRTAKAAVEATTRVHFAMQLEEAPDDQQRSIRDGITASRRPH